MSGVVINASQLTKLLNLNLIIWVMVNMPKKERLRSADKTKRHFFPDSVVGFLRDHSGALVLVSKLLG